MGTPSKQFAARQAGPSRCKAPIRPFSRKPAATAPGDFVPISPGVHFSSAAWQQERVQRLARICRALEKGRAAGKRLRRMFRLHVWRWKGRHYTSAPDRPVQFSYASLQRAYYRWRASGGNPQALAHRWRSPVKLRKGHVLDFARVCINSGVRSFPEAFGRLPKPRATVFAYRLELKPQLLGRIVGLFAARRLVESRARRARAILNAVAQEGAA